MSDAHKRDEYFRSFILGLCLHPVHHSWFLAPSEFYQLVNRLKFESKMSKCSFVQSSMERMWRSNHHCPHQLPCTKWLKAADRQFRMLAPVVEVHYRLQSVSSTSGDVSFKSWQERDHDIHPVSLVLPADVRCKETHSPKIDHFSVKNDSQAIHRLSETERAASSDTFCPVSGLGRGVLLNWRPDCAIQAVKTKPELYTELYRKVGTGPTCSTT